MPVKIPRRMARLDRDPRGYPIPFGVYRDPTGRAHFTINDDVKRATVIVRDLCPICGQLLTRQRWFVGGPASAFHPHGAYIDPPMHDECAHYALAVCPYLAAPNYNRRIDGATLGDVDDPATVHMLDETQIVERPDVFVAVLAREQTITDVGYIVPARPYLRVEVWRHGRALPVAEGAALLKPIVDALDGIEARRRPMRFISRK